jgi:hypothetical protein
MELEIFLIQIIYRFTEFYNINVELSELVDRDIVLNKIKQKDSNAYLALSDFIEGQLKLHKISTDEDLKQQSFTVWKGSLLIAKEEAYSSALWLYRFSRENGISLTGLIQEKV